MTFDPLKTSKTLTYSLSADFAEIEKSTKSTTYSRKPVVGYEMTMASSMTSSMVSGGYPM